MKVKKYFLWILIIFIAIIVTASLPKLMYLMPKDSFLYNWLIEPMKFYDKHSDFFQIVVTVVLAFITFIYVLLTRKLANSSMKQVDIAKENNELGVRPVVVLREIEIIDKLLKVLSVYIRQITPVKLKEEIYKEKIEVLGILLMEAKEVLNNILREIKDKEIANKINDKLKQIERILDELSKEKDKIRKSVISIYNYIILNKLNKKLEKLNEKFKVFNELEPIFDLILKELENKISTLSEIVQKIIESFTQEEKKEIENLSMEEKYQERDKKLDDLYKKYWEKILINKNYQNLIKKCEELTKDGPITYSKLLEKFKELHDKYFEIQYIRDNLKELYSLYNDLYKNLEDLKELKKQNSEKEIIEEINRIVEDLNLRIVYIFKKKKSVPPLLNFILYFNDYIKFKNIGMGPALNIRMIRIVQGYYYVAKDFIEGRYIMTGIDDGEEIPISLFYEEIKLEKLKESLFTEYTEDKNVKALFDNENNDKLIVFLYDDIFNNKFMTVHYEYEPVSSIGFKTMEFYKLERNEKH